MTDRELMQQALEALDAYSWEQVQAATTALRKRLAQPNEFEPDWDQVEALQESLREHMAEIHRLRQWQGAEREKVAQWIMAQGYATGHGDTVEDLLKELEWQIEERIKNEREACAKVCDVLAVHPEYASDITKVAAQAIRARGNT